MPAFVSTKMSVRLLIVIAAAAALCVAMAGSTSSAASVPINLCAVPGTAKSNTAPAASIQFTRLLEYHTRWVRSGM